jgi:ribosomal protein L32
MAKFTKPSHAKQKMRLSALQLRREADGEDDSTCGGSTRQSRLHHQIAMTIIIGNVIRLVCVRRERVATIPKNKLLCYSL